LSVWSVTKAASGAAWLCELKTRLKYWVLEENDNGKKRV